MNRKKELKNYLKKLIVGFTIGAVAVISVMVYLAPKEFVPWNRDVTEIHNLYVDTKDIKRLEELEQILREKQIEYTISENNLKTDFFNYNVQNKEEIVMEENDYTENFLGIDNRDTDKVSYSIKYEDNQSIETITLGDFRKVNEKYYIYAKSKVIGGFSLYIIISLLIIYLAYQLRKEKLGI